MFNDTSNENFSNKGIQVDLGEYLDYKKQFNDTRTISYSSSDLYHKRKKEQEEARSDFFIYGGASAVSAKVLYEKAKKDEGIKALISEVPGAKLLKQKLTKQYLDNQAAQIISGAIDPRSTAVAPLSQSLQSILVSLEELSPSQILKTLQLSSFNSLFVEVIDEERKKARHIKQTSIQVYENYYKNLIFKESKIKLSDEDIKHGFILQNNKLYQATPVTGNKGEVKAGRVLLDYATVVNSTIKTGDNHHSVNRVFEKFTNIYDSSLNRSQLHTEPFVIVGGASKKSTVATWARAYGRFSLEIGAKSLDNPLGFLEEYLDMTGLNNSKLVKNKYFQTAKGFTNFKLGTGGVYNISSAEMMRKIGKNLAIKGAAGVVGLNIIDATLDALTPDSSVWSSGLVAGMADTFMKAHVKFAELWSDNFQDLKKSQENSAPESTKLSTLIGVPLAGAMTGANLAFFKRMRDTATKGLEQSSTVHTAEQKLGGLLGKAADKVGINIVGNTLSRYSKVGALLGATLTLPFLPGALVGKSSEELRQEYSGEKEVAVRKDRGWLAGGTEYEGGQIKYFRQNLLRTIASDAKTKTLYGDRETKRRLDPVFNPIKYLRNPYRFEEMHQEDMPFPVWGMDVSYGSLLGQLYKGTIGELIKPTVIHPEFLKLQSEANPNLVLGVKGEIAKGISETISGKNSKSLSKLSAGNSEENSDTSIAIVDSDAYTTPENERKEVKSLIADGLMLRANAPTVSVLDRTLAGTSASLSDFTGLKGFSSSLLLGAANLDPTEQLRPELEVSGSSTSFSDTLSDANLGDMLGCFVPNTKVLTSTGYKEIQNITKGDLVLSKNGVFQKVNEVFEKSFKDIQILKVSLGLGYEDIYCTPDHVFPVIKRVRYSCGHLKPLTDFTAQDLEIGSLETGSLLMLPKNKETKVFDIDLGLTYSGVKTNCYLYPKSKYEKFGELYETLEVDPGLGIKDLKLLGFNQNQSKDMKTRLSSKKASVQRISRKIVLNKNIGKLIGWWLAEGSVDCGRISISLHKDELHFAKELMEIIKETLNVQCSLNYSKTSNGIALRFNHKPFSEYLLNTFGNKSYNKQIPEEYILNTEVRRGIIFGICHGDGWYNKDIKKGGYTSTSYELCKAVSRMLRYEGVLHNMLCNYDDSENHILPGKREVKSQFHKRNNIVINQLEAFNLYLALLEVDPCSIVKVRPNFSNFEDDNYTYISIKNIEVLDYSGLMYDLNIENTPYYTVNDVLCHNSGEFSRRLIPQSAAVKRDTVNPMRNQVAPDWLPKNETKYYKNFERGNYYCLAPNSLLETSTLEVKKACEIKIGDKLLGKFGKNTEVKNIATIPSKEILKITINGSNNIPTYITGEHPVAVRFKTYGNSEPLEKTKLQRILKVLKNTDKGMTYCKSNFYDKLEVSIPTFSTLFKQIEKEGYIINNKKTIIRTYKDLPDEYLFENNIYFKEAKDLKVGDYVAYPKYREKLDIIQEFDLATISGWSAVSERYVYYTRDIKSVTEFEWLRGESNVKPENNINMSITKENHRDTRKIRFDRYLKLDKNLGLFCGLWLAEGCKRGTAHHISEYEFVNNIYHNSPLQTYQWCPIKDTNGAQMRYSCKALDMFLEYTFGNGAKDKYLNNYLLSAPEEFIKGLVEGYYFGDGTTYNNKGRYSETATSVSDKLLVQLKLLMVRRLGIVSILNDYKYAPKHVIINGVIKGIDSGYRQNLVIRKQESTSNLWTQDDNFYYFRINKIEKESCDKVYAFETSDNTFCTYSMLTHNSHMENGEYLLPGSKGFETLNPELKGVDPNNYPLVYQYKILQNVARGSSEHIAVKKYLAEHLDELSEKEKDVFFEAYGQDTERDVQKRFTDYKTGSEKSNMGVIGLTQNAIWESFSHLESPLEPLTPFRPMTKFVHQRTAVEDYIKTQLMGSDVGIWTNPYSHFLKPTLNRLADSGSIDQFKPKEAIEKENIDTYFDKLSLVKAIKTNDTYDIERNVTALSYLGINDPGSMKRFKSALPEGQSAYVEAFSQEKDKKKRNQILSLVPKDIGRAYQSIWSNIDIYDQAILKGKDPNKALEEEYLKDSKKLKSAFSIDITRQDRETIHNQASTLANDEDKKRFEQYQEAKLIRLKAAQKEATEYVENQTGSLPSDNWIGWDPRLTIDDIKLKTLTIGREDIHRFGYWQKDLERSERLIGLKEGGIVNELENIKAEKRSNVAKEFAIRSRLRNIGFEVSTINSVPSNSNQLKITDKQEYLRAYNNSV